MEIKDKFTKRMLKKDSVKNGQPNKISKTGEAMLKNQGKKMVEILDMRDVLK